MVSTSNSANNSLRRATVPHGVRVYAIGDIHGRADLLDRLTARIDADLHRNPVPHSIEIYLGDYIDRGPSSREVIDRLIARQRTHSVVCLKGNHESLVTDFIKHPEVLAHWQEFGALTTLMSYGLHPKFRPGAHEQVELAREFNLALPKSHREFFANLKLYFSCGDYFFVHAGVKPGIRLGKQREEDLLWIRDEFLSYEGWFGKIVVHGHTPVKRPDFRTNRINIDTGAYATGVLTGLILEDHYFNLVK
jgi:serine/threonine protein phosphatase 1